jgi:hypothetical protein
MGLTMVVMVVLFIVYNWSSVLKNILDADQDGYLVVRNLDTNSEHRIKITYAEGSRPLIQDVKIDDNSM